MIKKKLYLVFIDNRITKFTEIRYQQIEELFYLISLLLKLDHRYSQWPRNILYILYKTYYWSQQRKKKPWSINNTMVSMDIDLGIFSP